jgi:hypothetical protein
MTNCATRLLDIKAPTPAAVAGERKGLERAKQEAKTREKKPRGLIEYYGSKMGFARDGPLLQKIEKRKFRQHPASF